MRIHRGLAFVGLVVGAFMVPATTATGTTALQQQQAASLDKLFSSDGPESLHEAKNQGTLDEPKAWPDANAWLHAQLSDAERDFLSLTATGTVMPNPDITGGLTSEQLSSTTGSVTVTVRLFQSTLTTGQQTQFRDNVVAACSLSSTASVSTVTLSPTTIGGNLFTLVSFKFMPNGGNTAGAQFQQFAAQFPSSSSALRMSPGFANVDLNMFPTATFVVAPTTLPTNLASTMPPTALATTMTPTTQAAAGAYCATHPTACLNAGTCVDGATATSYTCNCATGFIGSICQFSLFGGNRRGAGAMNAGGVARGKSVTRPNAAIKPKSA